MQNYWTEMGRRRISRRRMISAAGATGFVLAGIGLADCGGGSDSSTPQQPQVQNAAAPQPGEQPVAGGTFTLGGGPDNGVFDPANHILGSRFNVWRKCLAHIHLA